MSEKERTSENHRYCTIAGGRKYGESSGKKLAKSRIKGNTVERVGPHAAPEAQRGGNIGLKTGALLTDWALKKLHMGGGGGRICL